MSLRIARLLSTALIGAGLSTFVFAAGQTITWRGDDVSARSVAKGLAQAYQSSGNGSVTVQQFNTASGLDAVSNGSADVAGSARGSSGSILDSGLTFTPVAWDALVLITSPSNPVSELTLRQVHDIYYGKITNWRDVGGPDTPIDVYAVASPGDGVEFSLRRLLFGRGSQPVAAPRLYVNTVQLEQGVILDPRSFGVTTLSSVVGNPRIKMIRVEGSAPSASSLASGSYPLFTPLYLVTRNSASSPASAQAFVDFAKSAKGKAVLREHRLVPYDDGMELASLDASRRARILASVGARASSEPTMIASAAPATRAAAAAEPVTATRLAATTAATRTPVAPSEPALTGVTGSVIAAPEVSSLKGVRGDAFTVIAASNQNSGFAKVTADAVVIYGKPNKLLRHTADVATPMPVTKHVALVKAAPATYRVGAGETLYSIARQHGVEVAQIRDWNHLKDNTVHAGQVLRVGAR